MSTFFGQLYSNVAGVHNRDAQLDFTTNHLGGDVPGNSFFVNCMQVCRGFDTQFDFFNKTRFNMFSIPHLYATLDKKRVSERE